MTREERVETGEEKDGEEEEIDGRCDALTEGVRRARLSSCCSTFSLLTAAARLTGGGCAAISTAGMEGASIAQSDEREEVRMLDERRLTLTELSQPLAFLPLRL